MELILQSLVAVIQKKVWIIKYISVSRNLFLFPDAATVRHYISFICVSNGFTIKQIHQTHLVNNLKV